MVGCLSEGFFLRIFFSKDDSLKASSLKGIFPDQENLRIFCLILDSCLGGLGACPPG
jgi:hypothetical protein